MDNPTKCIHCGDDAVAVYYMSKGCFASDTTIQPLCMQHIVQMRPTASAELLKDLRAPTKMLFNITFLIRGPAGHTAAPNNTNPVEASNLRELLRLLEPNLPCNVSLGIECIGLEVQPVEDIKEYTLNRGLLKRADAPMEKEQHRTYVKTERLVPQEIKSEPPAPGTPMCEEQP